ncbi:Protein of unknown function [Cotesia congregata]|uniref:Uncharacterized protein n=1 Tax=Cotesia congregata TaxID=51543 RepID=A0A8J2HSD6_COTCN|nr:Protein of unknown function [Cotesia congregata]
MLLHDMKNSHVKNRCNIRLNNFNISEVEKTKYLGIIIDENLTFKDNANEIINKMARKLNVMYRLGNVISSYSKNLIYKTIIAPYIDYCSSVMINFSLADMDRIQKIQNRAMRLVLGVNKYTRVSDMLETLGWMSVKQRIIFNTCIFIHKLKLNRKPEILVNKIIKIDETHNYNTRSGSNVVINKTKAHTAEKCLTYKGYEWYNSLLINVRNEDRLMYFRKSLKEYVKQKY